MQLRAIDLLQRTPMVPMDGRALTASIAALCACGRHKRAETLLKGFMASSGASLRSSLCPCLRVCLQWSSMNSAAYAYLSRAAKSAACELQCNATSLLTPGHAAGTDLPPVQAFGALIAGYTRAALLERALEAMKDFCRRGGVPDAAMVGNIVPLCLRSGSYRQAVQVGRS